MATYRLFDRFEGVVLAEAEGPDAIETLYRRAVETPDTRFHNDPKAVRESARILDAEGRVVWPSFGDDHDAQYLLEYRTFWFTDQALPDPNWSMKCFVYKEKGCYVRVAHGVSHAMRPHLWNPDVDEGKQRIGVNAFDTEEAAHAKAINLAKGRLLALAKETAKLRRAIKGWRRS